MIRTLPILFAAALLISCGRTQDSAPKSAPAIAAAPVPIPDSMKWEERSRLIAERFYAVYAPTWEGANGAIGDAYRFRTTRDSTILRRYLYQFDLTQMDNGTWVDDRAWICLAELDWWEATGRLNRRWVEDAMQRYMDARNEGRLSTAEGFWSWYNYSPEANAGVQIFTNSNMNQMVLVACRLFDATGDQRFLDDALKVWNGEGKIPGIEKTFYRGNGVWSGKDGRAAFGKQLPWESASYLSVLAGLYRSTHNEHFRQIAIASAKHIIAPSRGWIDPVDGYQVKMDGNGAFVHFLLDAYSIAPKELSAIPPIIDRMLKHVWSNGHGTATVTLHRESDHGIRNGWNPHGGEDGYGVDEIGTKHAQSQALRAFALYAWIRKEFHLN